MHVHIVTPKPVTSGHGNGVSASRYTSILEDLGHAVTTAAAWHANPVEHDPAGHDCDLLLALHARRSHGSIVGFHRAHPDRSLVVVLTGTDLYSDLPDDPDARESLRLADRLVALQEAAPRVLDAAARAKLVIIEQSKSPTTPRRAVDGAFQVAILSHLRSVKDPLLPARASRLLPADSRVAIRHAGMAIDAELAASARQETESNPRYRWLGELDGAAAEALLAESHVLALPSRLEGGANVVSEAIALGVPVIGSHIDGTLGLLGDDYAGLHPVGDAQALADLMIRAETDRGFYSRLESQVAARRHLIDPARERRLWRALLDEVAT